MIALVCCWDFVPKKGTKESIFTYSPQADIHSVALGYLNKLITDNCVTKRGVLERGSTMPDFSFTSAQLAKRGEVGVKAR